MICPNCAAHCDDDLRFCDHCGVDLSCLSEDGNLYSEDVPVIQVIEHPVPTKQQTVSEPKSPPASVPKKGRLWPPILILSIMICTGILLFFLLPSGSASGGTAMPWFTVENGALSFHPEYYSGSKELTIPKTVNGKTVTAIADYAFSGADTITTVILPDTVKQIGDYAFSGCTNLRGIYIPSQVRSIGVYAFADCDSLEAIYLPGSLEELGHDSLSSCNSLHYILFDGPYSQWVSLYSGHFFTTVELHTIDGVYYTRP